MVTSAVAQWIPVTNVNRYYSLDFEMLRSTLSGVLYIISVNSNGEVFLDFFWKSDSI